MSHSAPQLPPRRVDELLVAQGLVESRSAAQRLIKAGKVTLGDGVPITKPSRTVPPSTKLIVTEPLRFISRGGDKLEAWFTEHPMEVGGLIALDVGASTGGFTDCLLQRGVAHVTCVDVGHGQLHNRIAEDTRVTSYEGINAKQLGDVDLPHETYDLVVADLSFISLTKVLAPIWNRLAPGGSAVFLVKPQFEVAKELVDRGKGIIRDDADRAAALASVQENARQSLAGAEIIGSIECPIAGGDGNREYLLGLRKQ